MTCTGICLFLIITQIINQIEKCVVIYGHHGDVHIMVGIIYFLKL